MASLTNETANILRLAVSFPGISFNTCSIGLSLGGVLKGGGGTVDGDAEIGGILKVEGGGTVDGADLLHLKIKFFHASHAVCKFPVREWIGSLS